MRMYQHKYAACNGQSVVCAWRYCCTPSKLCIAIQCFMHIKLAIHSRSPKMSVHPSSMLAYLSAYQLCVSVTHQLFAAWADWLVWPLCLRLEVPQRGERQDGETCIDCHHDEAGPCSAVYLILRRWPPPCLWLVPFSDIPALRGYYCSVRRAEMHSGIVIKPRQSFLHTRSLI